MTCVICIKYRENDEVYLTPLIIKPDVQSATDTFLAEYTDLDALIERGEIFVLIWDSPEITVERVKEMFKTKENIVEADRSWSFVLSDEKR